MYNNNINDTGGCKKPPVFNVNKNKGSIIYSNKDGVVIKKYDEPGGGLYDSRNKFYKDSKC